MFNFATDNVTPASKKFGLNIAAASIISMDFVKSLGGFQNEDGIIIFEFMFNGEAKPTRYTIFAPTQKPVKWEKGTSVELKKGSEEYNTAIKRANQDVVSVLTHIFKALGVSEEAIKQAFEEKKPTKFVQVAQLFKNLLPANYSEIKLDVFMQWQKKIGKNATRKFLEIPTKMYTGKFLCPATEGPWEEVKGADGTLKYVKYDNEGAIIDTHPFARNASFMESDNSKYDSEGRLAENAATHEDGIEDTPFDHEDSYGTTVANDSEWL